MESDFEFEVARRLMVDEQLRGRDIVDPRVLAAMGELPRHRFVPDEQRPSAYEDRPLPLSHGQTISQPYVVALMTQLARPEARSRALDVGTGSGYQAAILSRLCRTVESVEIVPDLADDARRRLAELRCDNVRVHCADGYRGWPDSAPYDLIIAAAAADHVPPALVEQLADGGRLVLPVGRAAQQLLLIEKMADGDLRRRTLGAVLFVPMTGAASRR